MDCSEKRRIPKPDRVSCRTCGTPIEVTKGRGRPPRYCSEVCKRRFRTFKRRLVALTRLCRVCGSSLPRGHDKYCSLICRRKAEADRAPKTKPCRVCGTPIPRGLRTCGDCKAAIKRERDYRNCALRRARLRGVACETAGRTEILDRDGWRCHLCGKKIRKDLTWPHTGYGTVDHIVALAAGGTHTKDNLAAAHFLCNMRKGQRGANAQLRLVG